MRFCVKNNRKLEKHTDTYKNCIHATYLWIENDSNANANQIQTIQMKSFDNVKKMIDKIMQDNHLNANDGISVNMGNYTLNNDDLLSYYQFNNESESQQSQIVTIQIGHLKTENYEKHQSEMGNVMPIHVELWMGQTITIYAMPNDTIETFKIKIQNKVGIHFDRQTLMFKSEELHNKLTLSDYDIEKSAKICFVKPRTQVT